MSVTFKQSITPWSGTTSKTSGSFTPAGGSGDVVCVFVHNVTSASGLSTTSSNGTIADLSGFVTAVNINNQYWQPAANMAAAAVAQTLTIHGNTSDSIGAWALEYSGCYAMRPNWAFVTAPGTGSGAIAGQPALVPTGAVLVAVAWNASNDTPTITGGSGSTSRASGTIMGGSYRIAEWAGAGASITPTFTTSADGSDYYEVFQMLLLPTGAVMSREKQETETSAPYSAALTEACSVGDVIFVVTTGGATSNPFPLTVSDNVNSGAYTLISSQFYDATARFFGAIYMKVVNTAGTPTVTVSGSVANGFCSVLSTYGWTGTPTVDTGAQVTYSDNSGSSTTQAGAVSAAYGFELLLAAAWNSSYISFPGPSNWINCSPTSGETDSDYFAFVDVAAANNFSGTIAGASDWSLVFTGVYDAATAICTNKGWTQAGAFEVPVAGSTVVWRKDGTFGTVDCSTVEYYQEGGAFGTS